MLLQLRLEQFQALSGPPGAERRKAFGPECVLGISPCPSQSPHHRPMPWPHLPGQAAEAGPGQVTSPGGMVRVEPRTL